MLANSRYQYLERPKIMGDHHATTHCPVKESKYSIFWAIYPATQLHLNKTGNKWNYG